MQSPDLLRVFLEPLERNKLEYFVTGSVASIFYGEPRLTHDIDIVMHLSTSSLALFVSLFRLEDFYCPPEDILQIENKRRPYGHINLIHHKSGFKADIYLDAGEPLQQWAMKHRKRAEISTGFAIWLAPPEYLIIRKLEFFREGNSSKHLEDIRKMLPQIKDELDEKFLNEALEKRGLLPLWQGL